MNTQSTLTATPRATTRTTAPQRVTVSTAPSKTIPIEERDPYFNEANLRWIDEGIAQARRGEFVAIKTMEELEAMAE